MRYLLTCRHCGGRIIETERVSDAAASAVEVHLRADHAHMLPDVRRLYFAEVLDHVRVKME